MPRYRMHLKWISLGRDYTVQDESGQDVFLIDGRALSLGDQLSIRDMAGNELASISQKLLSWGPTYEIRKGGEVAAVVKEKLFTLFRAEFAVDVPGPDDLVATGNFTDYEYNFRRGDQQVAVVSKRLFSWTDSYGIDIQPEEDDALIIAAAVVIDLCRHRGE